MGFSRLTLMLMTFLSSMMAGSSTLAGADELKHFEIAMRDESRALTIVENRTSAYNNHDIEAFLAAYDEHVRIYEYPDKFLGEGKERMRKIFGKQFSDSDGTIVVHRQHALGNIVVSDETVTFYGHTEHNIGVYTVKKGLITEVRLIEP